MPRTARSPIPALALLVLAACEPADELSADAAVDDPPDAVAEAGLDLDAEPAGPPGSALARVEGEVDPLFLGVWASGPDEVFFAGGGRGPTGGVLARFDGDRITQEPIPEGRTLWWVWGSDPRHVWACGEGGRIIGWADRAWREEATGLPDSAVLWGLWGSSAADVWAVGGSPQPGGPKGVVMRSDGRGDWWRVDDPALPVDLNLYKVWGTGPDDVHIVGEGGVALHYDGEALRPVETGTTDLLFTVHGRVDGPVLAVGGLQSAVVRRFDGVEWVDDGAPEGLPPLNGVYVRRDGVAIVSGNRGVVAVRDVDGAWTRLPGAQEGGWASDTLHAVLSAGDTWAVGGDFASLAYGTILTDRRPLPVVDLSAVAPPRPLDMGLDPPDLDGGAPDATPDAMPDAWPDAAPDAIPDVFPDAMPPMDAEPLDAAVDLGPDLAFARCGDGLLSVLEDCDDGNTEPGDGCDARCRFECGNGRLDGDEQCDDGNRVGGDGCDGNCGSECGNGVLDPAEACDDGDNAPGDGCDPLCRLECGNGALEGAEQCDDGGQSPDDGCDAECRLECGNGRLDGAEECDDGGRAPGDGCGAGCRFECGDGVVDAAEECDDGNRAAGDGCDAGCRVECGNGLLDGDEECDDGDRVGGDGCDPMCLDECGNGQLDGGEECDDGGRAPLDGCDAACRLECGNGVIEGDEQCDDGNRVNNDGCDMNCRQRCGNGRVDGGEQCDDGNRVDGDGCSAGCLSECGNGVLGGDEECDDGNRVADDGCDPGCRLECGNGEIDFGEQCDDGNRDEDDGCDAACRRECGNGEIEGDEECDDGNIVAFDGCDPACRREALPGPGEDCRGFLCAEGLSCFGVAQAGFRNVCTHPCETNDDCADFEVETCCEPPGPQLVDAYCVRRDMLRNGCANEQ